MLLFSICYLEFIPQPVRILCPSLLAQPLGTITLLYAHSALLILGEVGCSTRLSVADLILSLCSVVQPFPRVLFILQNGWLLCTLNNPFSLPRPNDSVVLRPVSLNLPNLGTSCK